MKDGQLDTRDHYVPRMYLKRFAQQRSASSQLIAMTRDQSKRFPASVNDVAVKKGFYWGTDIDGVPHHHLEQFFTAVESEATGSFRRILDSGKHHTDDALPPWPPRPLDRLALSWWLAAQVLRTVRQRSRLDVASAKSVEVPNRFESSNRHIGYIAEMIEDLAAAIYFRPWGIGFSDYCLMTGDVPVIVINGQDHQDQGAAIRYWDVYLPLDPHRCLYLPGLGALEDRSVRHDHRFKLHPGHAIGLNSLIIDTAVRHIFFHPQHDPSPSAEPAVSAGDADLPRFILHYELIPSGYGVERRWLDTHPPSADRGKSALDGARALDVAQELIEELEERKQGFDAYRDSSSP